MKKQRSLACLLSIAVLLLGCHRPQPAAPAPAPKPAPIAPPAAKIPLTAEQQREQELMEAVFGARYRPAQRAALAALTDPENRSERSSYYLTAQGHKMLDSGDAVLVANARPSSQYAEDPALEDIDEPETGHAEPGLLNVFILRPRRNGGWAVIGRHENVAQLGSNGQLGAVSWPMLAKDKPGLAINYGWMGQGYMIDFLELFDLSDPQLRNLTPEENKLNSNNEGACDEPRTPCWSVEGKWRFAASAAGTGYDDLVIEFSGKAPAGDDADAPEQPENEKAPVHAAKKIADSARYVFDGKRYRLAEGRNPVPDI